MHIRALQILNFRGIKEVQLHDLGNMIIIAGQNGSGKSCIFDGIRLLKSVYGGYQQNEWQQWMGEFQINLAVPSSFKPIFNDETKDVLVRAEFSFSDEELTFLKTNANELLRETVWRTLIPEAYQWGGARMASFTAQFREREPEVALRVKNAMHTFLKELQQRVVIGEFSIDPMGTIRIGDSAILPAVFSTFRPQEVGVIDFHSAQRHYNRELVQGINLNLDGNQQQRSQTALYNYAAKYNNVKSEMAASFVKEILAEQAGVPRAAQSTLTNTLKELFQTFFPEKEFLGPKPTADGALSFPVRTTSGSIHDLDELSAGEKEILYGYLRIRNSAPRHSIILLDEPELHLNPRLIRGLPQFYQKNLGEALGNQMWLVTHSDALLREVVGRDKYNVFHMLPCANVSAGESQLKPLSASGDLELALVDLVGDLAAYRPGGKVVIFEGGGDADFDQWAVSMLFPELSERANLVSGTNKVRVRALHETLERMALAGSLPFEFYSITDMDTDGPRPPNQVGRYQWGVYHIENYLLVPQYISRVRAALGQRQVPSHDEVLAELRACAVDTLPSLVRHELGVFVNSKLVSCIDTNTSPSASVVESLDEAIGRSLRRIEALRADQLDVVDLRRKAASIEDKYRSALSDGSWIKVFRGRDILKSYVNKHGTPASYEIFRNLIISSMRDDGFRPEGMSEVISQILS